MASATIAAGIARALLKLAVTKGAKQTPLLQQSGIDPRQLDDPDARIPMAQYMALMRAGQQLCSDPALALHFGEAFDMADMSIVGLLGMASETGEDMLAQLNRYERLVADVATTADGPRHALVRKNGRFWLQDRRAHPNDFPELTESSFARMVCMAHRAGKGAKIIHAVHVTHPAPNYRAEYERIFRVPVHFDSDCNAIVLSGDAWLHERTSQASPYVFGVFGDRAQALLERLERSTSTRGRIESLLIPILHTDDVSLDRIVNMLGISRQTVYRKLKAEGTTFQQTLDELRHRMALHYLSDNKMSVNQTAYLIGFSDPAAFSRAFKRWTGSSPRAMRRKVGMS